MNRLPYRSHWDTISDKQWSARIDEYIVCCALNSSSITTPLSSTWQVGLNTSSTIVCASRWFNISDSIFPQPVKHVISKFIEIEGPWLGTSHIPVGDPVWWPAACPCTPDNTALNKTTAAPHLALWSTTEYVPRYRCFVKMVAAKLHVSKAVQSSISVPTPTRLRSRHLGTWSSSTVAADNTRRAVSLNSAVVI